MQQMSILLFLVLGFAAAHQENYPALMRRENLDFKAGRKSSRDVHPHIAITTTSIPKGFVVEVNMQGGTHEQDTPQDGNVPITTSPVSCVHVSGTYRTEGPWAPGLMSRAQASGDMRGRNILVSEYRQGSRWGHADCRGEVQFFTNPGVWQKFAVVGHQIIINVTDSDVNATRGDQYGTVDDAYTGGGVIITYDSIATKAGVAYGPLAGAAETTTTTTTATTSGTAGAGAGAGACTTSVNSCKMTNKKFVPVDMPGGPGRQQVSAGQQGIAECQQLCQQTAPCAYFSFWNDGGCHLEDINASPQYSDGVAAERCCS